MDRNELRSAIGNILSEPWGIDLEDRILVLIAPILTDAEKWEKVKEIANTRPPCDCPLWDKEIEGCTSEHAGCVFKDVVEALKEAT